MKKMNGESVSESAGTTDSSLETSSIEGSTFKTSCPSTPHSCWPMRKASIGELRESLELCGDGSKEKRTLLGDDAKFVRLSSKLSEMDMMKERFSKLLLGEDLSGFGKGFCTASAISNAITSLCATVFGQLWRLEPLPSEKKAMWRREMEWLLSVGDNIVELIPSWQTLPDGTQIEVMKSRLRSDLFINLPALGKLDIMLLEILDSFDAMEFWYVDQGITSSDTGGSASFRKTIQLQENKRWLPVPRVPPGGLSGESTKKLNHMRKSANQVLKAAMVINSITLAEMDVPDSYLDALPKNGKACLGDRIYRYITSDQFSSECLLDCLDLSSEHVALEIANRVESSIHVWRRRMHSKPSTDPYRSSKTLSWGMVKDLVTDRDRRQVFAERAETLLLCLKQRFPSPTQTTLDTSKVQFNKDVGKAILESYSRVLESLAFCIIARIDDLLYVDELTKHSHRFFPVPTVNVIAHNKVSVPYSVPVSLTHRKTFSTPSFSPASLVSPAKGERSPFRDKTNIINNNSGHRLGLGVRRVLTNYLSAADCKAEICGNPN